MIYICQKRIHQRQEIVCQWFAARLWFICSSWVAQWDHNYIWESDTIFPWGVSITEVAELLYILYISWSIIALENKQKKNYVLSIYRFLYTLFIFTAYIHFFQNLLIFLHYISIQTTLSKNCSLSSSHLAINVQTFGDTVLIYRKEACSGIISVIFLERLDSYSPPPLVEWGLFLLVINKNIVLYFHILNTDVQCWFGISRHQQVW